ncbi:MAG: FAD-dependent oxidoreductase [Microscillaceae bacterium]|nr:FAD-dependent oxidoreductase [Microscillaceae bacterium]
MNRRKFLKNFVSLAGLGWAACQPSSPSAFPFPVYNSGEHRVGHLLRQGRTWPRGASQKTDFLIVGGGLAGLAAAYTLRNEDFILCELGQDFGGTASAQFQGTISLCQGAHYDLSYPDYFGEEVLGLLSELNIIHKKGAVWQFKDSQYLISAEQEEQCLANARYREGVLPNTRASRAFFAHTDAFVGQLCLPSRLTPPRFAFGSAVFCRVSITEPSGGPSGNPPRH